VKKSLLIFLILAIHFHGTGQTQLIDTLRRTILTEKEDSNKVKNLNAFTESFLRLSRYDTAMICASTALSLGEKLNYKRGIAGALKNKGVVFRNQGNYPKALECDFKSFNLYKEIGDKKGIGITLGNIGLVFWNQNNYAQALEYEMKALKIYRELGDKKGSARNLGNIGIIYFDQAHVVRMGNSLVNNDTLFAKALEYGFMSLKEHEEAGDKEGIAINVDNIANVYADMGNYPKALEFHFKALQLNRSIGFLSGVARDMNNISGIYINEKETQQASIYLDSALQISKSIRLKEVIRDVYKGLTTVDQNNGNHKKALQDYKIFIAYRDSLVNEANTKKTVQLEMSMEFEQKQTAEKAEQDKKDAVTSLERNKQKVIRNAFMGGFSLLFILVFFIYRGYQQKQQDNVIITQQKALVELQKELVEEKNKDILDSITYAKRLQDAILPPLNLIKQSLPDSFLLFKPKDIVSGDFYWLERTGDKILIACADATNHGVSGALVSVVCSNALNRAVKEFHLTETGQILDKVRDLVLETFENSETNVQDGMDVALCGITLQTGQVQYSGAFNSLWYIQNGAFKEASADKQPIGKSDKPIPFTTHNLQLKKGDTLYLFTDGFADQFGGEKGKKFKYKQLQNLLVTSTGKSMNEQQHLLETTLRDWKGDLEQVDDILIIGIRI
jgi:serine phosphatase RsbU (regulator of sigma subunit)